MGGGGGGGGGGGRPSGIGLRDLQKASYRVFGGAPEVSRMLGSSYLGYWGVQDIALFFCTWVVLLNRV